MYEWLKYPTFQVLKYAFALVGELELNCFQNQHLTHHWPDLGVHEFSYPTPCHGEDQVDSKNHVQGQLFKSGARCTIAWAICYTQKGDKTWSRNTHYPESFNRVSKWSLCQEIPMGHIGLIGQCLFLPCSDEWLMCQETLMWMWGHETQFGTLLC